ncbi:hypothetical protein PR048_031321 [Dryococelus australis]|uniref:Uncharacterized protein n=1 Tax=Dryococelus australis TaxID=614101 RepID=A0ABQ9G4X4_9NEOP|nr:hypothetical protein PR048_031321 [Dryococelus australis]
MYKFVDVNCGLVDCCHSGRRRLGQLSPGGVKHHVGQWLMGGGNTPTNDIVRHDSHIRKSGVIRPGIEAGSPWWEASRLTTTLPPWPPHNKNWLTAYFLEHCKLSPLWRDEIEWSLAHHVPWQLLGTPFSSHELSAGGGAGETGDLRENPPTNGIVRHDSHMRESGVIRPGIEPGSPWLEASRLTAQPPRPLLVRSMSMLGTCAEEEKSARLFFSLWSPSAADDESSQVSRQLQENNPAYRLLTNTERLLIPDSFGFRKRTLPRSRAPLFAAVTRTLSSPSLSCHQQTNIGCSRLSIAIGRCLLEKALSYLTRPLRTRQHRHGSYVVRVETVSTFQKVSKNGRSPKKPAVLRHSHVRKFSRVTPPGIERRLPGWETSRLTTSPPRPLYTYEHPHKKNPPPPTPVTRCGSRLLQRREMLRRICGSLTYCSGTRDFPRLYTCILLKGLKTIDQSAAKEKLLPRDTREESQTYCRLTTEVSQIHSNLEFNLPRNSFRCAGPAVEEAACLLADEVFGTCAPAGLTKSIPRNPLGQKQYPPRFLACKNPSDPTGNITQFTSWEASRSTTSVDLCSTAFGVGPLVFVRGSVNTEAYCNSLDNEVLPTLWRFYGMDPCYFQDDNARCHVSRATIQRNADNNVCRFDWPTQSPGLNPI